MSIPLQDSGGGIWLLGVTNDGLLTTNLSTGAAQLLLLTDNSNVTWQVEVQTSGLLSTTQTSTFDPRKFVVLKAPNGGSWRLSVGVLGLLQTTLAPPIVWVPNGLGAGVDNSIVGGGGGFMSYPQPPLPFGFNPPGLSGSRDGGNSWNLQAGSVNITVAAAGTWSVISNPGRNSTNQS